MPIKSLVQRTASRLIVVPVGGWVLIAALLVAPLYLQGCLLLHPECASFFSLDEKQRKEKIKTYPIEKQLDLYLCGMGMEPPYMEVAYDIAEEGPKNIPPLLKRLKAERYEPDKEHIIYIFTAMSVLGKLDCRQDVIEQIEQTISGMEVKRFRENAQRDLDEIKKNSCNS
jgi:hypothetical protein